MSQLAFVFLHVDCSSITPETSTPPRTLNEAVDNGIKAACPACGEAWIIRFETAPPTDLAPVDLPADLAPVD